MSDFMLKTERIRKMVLLFLISGSNEPSSRACMDGWQIPQGLSFHSRQRFKLHVVLLVVGGLILLFGTFGVSDFVCAENRGLPGDVVVVKNENAMIRILLKGMKAHKSYFSFYYPKIDKDFIKYKTKSSGYQSFLEQLSKKDGYITGILSGSCITVCGDNPKYVTFQFGYLTTKRQEKRINRKVRSIAKKIGKGTQVQKAKKAHDYLITHMRYDKRYYSPYHAFTKGRGMCMAYALAYQRILQEMKVPCIYIKGKNHAWNMVKIGSCWYNVDVTWDDAGGGYRYFLKSDAEFPGHKRPASRWLRSIRKAKRSYPIWKLNRNFSF